MGHIKPNPYVRLSWTQTTEVKRPLNFGLKMCYSERNF